MLFHKPFCSPAYKWEYWSVYGVLECVLIWEYYSLCTDTMSILIWQSHVGLTVILLSVVSKMSSGNCSDRYSAYFLYGVSQCALGRLLAWGPKGLTLADGGPLPHMPPICHARSHLVWYWEKVLLAAERPPSKQISSAWHPDLSRAEGYSSVPYHIYSH